MNTKTEERRLIDWNIVTFRASSWGNLLTEPQSKEDKLAGKLSVTCQKELIKIYNLLRYGRKYDVFTKQMEKGTIGEPESILLLSTVDKKLYLKNEEQLENEWFTGHPDIFEGETIRKATAVHDIKSRWSLESFMPKLIETIDPSEKAQMNVYFDLTGATSGCIVNTLIDCPATLLEGEKYALLRRLDVATEEAPAFKKEYKQLVKNLTFGDIDPRERIIKQPITRDDELIEKMKAKVPRLREWLADFEKKHLSQYKKEQDVNYKEAYAGANS